ncbi:dihydrolipoamide acetyltransferase family protein [Amycolatopsis japonica]
MSGVATELRMPRLSESMAEGTIVRWLHDSGAEVRLGDELAEIETDKSVVTFEAESAGILEIIVGEGESADVGSVIARIGDGPVPNSGVAKPSRLVASPLSRRRARELGVDLATLTGTGPHGRIVRADVEAAGRAITPGGPAPDSAESERVSLTRIQQATIRRLSAAPAIPTFALTVEADMTQATAVRAALAGMTDAAPTITDLVVAATARALRSFPRMNASAADGAVVLHRHVNIGIATETPDGLVVPVVADADTLSIAALTVAAKELVRRARESKLTPQDLDGATFTVSNLGMFGVIDFTAVLVPPQAGILAVGAARPRPPVHGDAASSTMSMTLTCDHRVLDGAEAARFLARLVELIEQPLVLLAGGG